MNKFIDNHTVKLCDVVVRKQITKLVYLINKLQEDNAKMNELSNELQVELAAATKYKDELIEKLQKHDLTRLSLKKPGLIEKRINNGTKQLFESFESLTGNNTTN